MLAFREILGQNQALIAFPMTRVSTYMSHLLEVALYEPEIPPNTGNIIRLCANTGTLLHLIGPLGFSLNDKNLKRAGLDYHEYVGIKYYENFEAFLKTASHKRILACTTKASQWYTQIHYQAGDLLLLGPETRGLPASVLSQISAEYQLRIPMLAESRSLNLSNAAAVILYEAWRQLGFQNGK